MRPYSILFCCMGNICRSPTAEGMFAEKARRAGMSQQLAIDSAGTHAYHVGEAPDPRTQKAAIARGYDLSGLRARAVNSEDFERFDLILAMDRANHAILSRLCPRHNARKIRLMMDYARNYAAREVPDPYGGGEDGFQLVLDMLEDATEGLLLALRTEHERGFRSADLR